MMKKTIALLLALVMLALGLPALAAAAAVDPAPYMGKWNAVSMTEDGQTVNPADFGISIIVVFDENGMVTFAAGDDVDTEMWQAAPNGLLADDALFVIQDDGTLLMRDDDESAVFERVNSEAPAAAEGSAVDPAPYMGKWNAVSMTEDGQTVNPADFGISVMVVFEENGVVSFAAGDDVDTEMWLAAPNGLVADDVLFTLQDDGTLLMRDDDESAVFERVSGEAVVAVEVSAVDPAPYMGKWNGISMFKDGETINLADVGMSITIVFDENGKVSFAVSNVSDAMMWQAAPNGLIADDALFALQDDGTLLMLDEDESAVFERVTE